MAAAESAWRRWTDRAWCWESEHTHVRLSHNTDSSRIIRAESSGGKCQRLYSTYSLDGCSWNEPRKMFHTFDYVKIRVIVRSWNIWCERFLFEETFYTIIVCVTATPHAVFPSHCLSKRRRSGRRRAEMYGGFAWEPVFLPKPPLGPLREVSG